MSESESIPPGWRWARLGDLALEMRNGISAKPHDEGNVPIFRISAVRPMALHNDDVRFLAGGPDQWSSYRVLPGDLLFTRYNGTRSLVGVCALAREPLALRVYPDKLIRVRVDPVQAVPGYVEKAVHVGVSRAAIEQSLKTSAGQVGISGAQLREVPIPLAPLEQQSRIVDKIDALTSKSRRAKEALDAIPPLLERFRQSVLAAAFRGDLTKAWREQHPDVEPAADLLARIRQERRTRSEQAELERLRAKDKANGELRAKHIEPKPADLSALPPLPSSWCWASFEEVADIAADLVDPTGFARAPHIAPDNIAKGTGRLLSYRTVADDGVKSAKHRFRPGQILYSKIRPYLNKCVVADFEGLCSADMYPIDSRVAVPYLHRYMLSNDFVRRIQANAGNRVVLPKANQEQLNAVAVPLAPTLEQEAIVSAVERTLSSTSGVERATFVASDRLASLDGAILAKAFRGELVD